jgi:hypothetical protein
MHIDESDGHDENTNCSIRESLEPGSNVTLESLGHPLKLLCPRTSTDAGTQIDESDEQASNADSSIRETFEPASKLTSETSGFPEKQ